jgi:hypothetical protein
MQDVVIFQSDSSASSFGVAMLVMVVPLLSMLDW